MVYNSDAVVERGKVYFLWDPITEEIRYIGITTKTLQHRLRGHLWDASHPQVDGYTSHRSRWIRKRYAESSVYPEIALLEEYDTITIKELGDRERLWIAYGHSQGWPLTNLTVGGEGVNGYSFSEEQKAHLRQLNLGNQHGRNLRHTIEDKAAMSRVKRGNQFRAVTCPGFVSPDGAVFSPVTNISAFSRAHGLDANDMLAVASGKKRHYKGWTRYVPEEEDSES